MTARTRRTRGSGKKGIRPSIEGPRASYEELEIHTEDGVALRAYVDEPPEGTPIVGTCVLAHAMFARRTSFGKRERPGLAHACTARGWRAIAFDFRGHGDSALAAGGRDWGYDELVRYDLPAVVACARARGEGKPVVVLGHSLGGHVAIAAQGTGRMHADGIVGLGANVWLRAFEPSRVRWAAKVALAHATLATVTRVGRLPVRRLRLGSDDESARYMRDLFRVVTRDAWESADGADDYLASMPKVVVPVASVLGLRDRMMCHPRSGEAFLRRCGGPLQTVYADADHAELVTNAASYPHALDALAWVLARSESMRYARP